MFVKTDVIFEDFGVTLPPCAMGGVQVTPQQQMSKNAGRNSNTGTFYGDVLNVKNVVSLSWNRLKEKDFAVIDKCLNNTISNHRVTMRLSPNEGYKSRNYYLAAGSYTYTFAVQIGDELYYDGVAA